MNFLNPQDCERVNGELSTDPSRTPHSVDVGDLALSTDGLGLSPAPVENDLSPASVNPHPHPMSLADGCPECVVNVETPSSTYWEPEGVLANYVCVDCGHAWTTSWRD